MAPRILVVDDELQILILFGRMLEGSGYSTRLLSSGEEVVPILREEKFELLAMDLGMPKPDGFELLKRLRAEMPRQRILVVSGVMTGALLKAAELLGATATLAKTDVHKLLLQTVGENLGKNSRR